MYSPINSQKNNILVNSRSQEHLNEDTCGYEENSVSMADTRSVKFQARVNHVSTASANKSFNFKSQMKYLKKKDQKYEREAKKAEELKQIEQMKQDSIKWRAVDNQDAKHMER